MPLFYILINSDLGSEKVISKEIEKKLDKSTKYEFVNVYGVYDIVLKINENTNARELQDKLRNIPKVHSTLILTVTEDE